MHAESLRSIRTSVTVDEVHAESLTSIRTSVTVDEVHAESFKNMRTTIIRGAFRKSYRHENNLLKSNTRFDSVNPTQKNHGKIVFADTSPYPFYCTV